MPVSISWAANSGILLVKLKIRKFKERSMTWFVSKSAVRNSVLKTANVLDVFPTQVTIMFDSSVFLMPSPP
jgi:hypothetical protein